LVIVAADLPHGSSDNGLPKHAIETIHARFPDLEVVLAKDLPAQYKDATIIVVNQQYPTIEEAPKLQLVQVTSAGANRPVSLPIFQDTKIPFCTANGVHTPQIPEWVLGTFLTSQHNLATYRKQQEQQVWKSLGDRRDSYRQRVGILGYGSIGRQVARLCKAMGMSVHAYTLHPKPTPESRRDHGYVPHGLGDPDGSIPEKWFAGDSTEEIHDFLGSDLDWLVLSVPLTEKTRHLISKREFDILAKKKAFVTNIARGPIINTDDFIEALETDKLRGAAVDVSDPEPLPKGHPLWTAKNLILTPHISGLSTDYMDRAFDILIENLARFSEGRTLINEISRKDGY
ncbi:hypothetical protein Golomagni_06996, partial [Golovinomyces magnicellulatus]